MKILKQKLFFLFFLFVIGGNTFAAEYAHVCGDVVDKYGRLPIVGATVRAGNIETITDKNGRYLLDLPAGYYQIEVIALGYNTYKGDLKINVSTLGESIILSDIVLTPEDFRPWPSSSSFYLNSTPIAGVIKKQEFLFSQV